VKSFRDRNPYAVGLVSVLVIGLITGLAFSVGLLHLLERAYTMSGEFSDAAGLRSGDEVKVAGVKVGRVTGIEADRSNGLVIVKWVVNNGVEIREDAGAEIALETLLGAKYIRITDPREGERLMEDLDKEERRIPCEPMPSGACQRTKTPYDVFELTRRATRNIEALDTQALNTFINDLADLTEGKQQQVHDLIEGLARVSTAINERDAHVRTLLERAETLSGTLAEKDQTLVDLIDASRGILDLLNGKRDLLASAIGDGSAAVAELARVIVDNEAQLDQILTVLHPTLDIVAAHQDDVDRSLAWLGPGLYGQALAGSHGPWLDIFVNALGPDIVAILCDVFDPGDPNCAGGA
jgi:phospholipid/cholesterol/gamma-HCH transport system substrate-binding protein